MYLLDKESANLIDALAVSQRGVPISLLMENAGQGVCQEALVLLEEMGRLPKLQNVLEDKPRVGIVVGVGNNGADGLVCARHLCEYGVRSEIIIYGDVEKGSQLFKKQLEILDNFGCLRYFSNDFDEEGLEEQLNSYDFLIDGIAGTGLMGNLRDDARLLTKVMNRTGKKIIAIDIPSGLHVDTGTVSDDAIVAHVTVTMGAPKVGMYLYPGNAYCGRMTCKPIGGPQIDLLRGRPMIYLGDHLFARDLLPQREWNAHKGTNGHVLIIGGNVGMWGAPILSAKGSLYSGAGKTTLGLRQTSYNEIMLKAPEEVMGVSLPSDDKVALTLTLEKALLNKDVVAIGPGLGRDEDSFQLLALVEDIYEGPLVIDADGLFCLGDRLFKLAEREMAPVLTPHVGEFSKLTGLSPKKIESNRIGVAREFAMEHKVVLVLKGAPTVIAYPDGTVIVNNSGNPGMGCGGMGDVLTGIIASFIGQGLTPEEAAVLGVYVHGLSADLLSIESEIGYTPSQVAAHLGKAMTNMETMKN